MSNAGCGCELVEQPAASVLAARFTFNGVALACSIHNFTTRRKLVDVYGIVFQRSNIEGGNGNLIV